MTCFLLLINPKTITMINNVSVHYSWHFMMICIYLLVSTFLSFLTLVKFFLSKKTRLLAWIFSFFLYYHVKTHFFIFFPVSAKLFLITNNLCKMTQFTSNLIVYIDIRSVSLAKNSNQ